MKHETLNIKHEIYFGNEKAQEILNKAVEGGYSHAYLLYGANCLGKRVFAKKFAQAILGEQIFEKFHPDLIVLDGKGEDADVANIKQIREMRRKIALFPQKAKMKVVLALDIDRMNKESLNAFLKSLEEPLEDVVFVLTASSVVLKTILSRCFVVKYFPLSNANMANMAREMDVDLNIADKALQLSIGKPGIFMSFIKNGINLKRRLSEIQEADIYERFDFAEQIVKEVEKIDELLYNWIGEARQLLINAKSHQEQIKLLAVLKELMNVLKLMKQQGANVKLILENLFLNI